MITILHRVAAVAVLFALVGCDGGHSDIVRPNKVQRDWAEAEIGVLIHYDMQVFRPDYVWRRYGSHPDPSAFNPTDLDTDQWMEAAAALGARYAVLVAKHGSGFSLWPTEALAAAMTSSALASPSLPLDASLSVLATVDVLLRARSAGSGASSSSASDDSHMGSEKSRSYSGK